MDNEILDQADVAKPAEEVETSETTAETTDQTAEAEAQAEAESVYKKELEKAQAIIKEKDGALRAERERRKAAESKKEEEVVEEEKPKRKYLSPEEAEKLLEEKLAAREFNQLIKSVSADADEQALVKHHYDNSIVKTGNVEADLKKAVAIANQHLIEQAKTAQMEREQTEAFNLSYQAGQPKSRQGKPSFEANPVLKRSAAILDKLGAGDAKKYLS